MPSNKPRAAKATIGAVVQYCGHNGSFVADIYRVGNATVVRASEPVTMAGLDRTLGAVRTHRVQDMPVRGFWRPDLGVFVVPMAQVTELPRGLDVHRP